MPESAGWLTTQDAADALEVNRRRVLALIASKRLPAQKVGRDWLILRTDLELVRGKTIIKRWLSEDEVRTVRERRAQGESVASLAKYYGVKQTTIYRHLRSK